MPAWFKRILLPWRIVMKAFCFGIFGFGSLILGAVVFPMIQLLVRGTNRRDRVMRAAVRASFGTFVFLMSMLGLIRVRWTGDQLKLHGLPGCMVIANHPSLIDIVILMSRIPNADCIVKDALFHFPLIRLVVSKLYISNALSGNSLLEACGKSLSSGNTLVVFPEGTRSQGDDIGRVSRGAARIAIHSGCATLPVRIDTPGARGLRKGDAFFSYREEGPICYTLGIGDIIPVESVGDVSPAIGARRLTDVFLRAIN